MNNTGNFKEKLRVYKAKAGRFYVKVIQKLQPKRRLAHLSPAEESALGTLSARMTKNNPGKVFNLSEGTSQVGNAFGMFICYAI